MAAVVDMKQRNPTWGCPRIAQQIALAFGIPINKDVVRRILAVRYRPEPDSGASWLTVLGHTKDSLWSLDLFRCESRSVPLLSRPGLGFDIRLVGQIAMDDAQLVGGFERVADLPRDGERLIYR